MGRSHIPGAEDSRQCQGREGGVCLGFLEDQKEAGVSGAEGVMERHNRRRERENGDQVLLGHLRASTFTLGKMGSTWKFQVEEGHT